MASPDDPSWSPAAVISAHFLNGVKAEAASKGASGRRGDEALAGAQIDQKVLSRDRAQGVFRQTFLEFSQRTVSQARLDIGRQKMQAVCRSTFARAENEFGVAGWRHYRFLGAWRPISAPSRAISTPATRW